MFYPVIRIRVIVQEKSQRLVVCLDMHSPNMTLLAEQLQSSFLHSVSLSKSLYFSGLAFTVERKGT